MLQIDEGHCNSSSQNIDDAFPKMALVRLLISCAALLLTGSLFIFHTRKFAVHPNSRLVIKSHYCLALFNSVAQAVIPVYELHNYAISGSKCSLTTHAECIKLTIWSYYAICAVSYSLTYISIERLSAFIFYRFTNSTPKRWFGFVLVFFQWATPVVEITFMLKPCDFEKPVYRCSFIVQDNLHVFYLFIVIFLGFEVFASCIFTVINFLAKKERIRHFHGSDVNINFTRRYELQEMLRTVYLLIPTVFLHSIMFLLPYTVIEIFLIAWETIEQERFLFYLELLDWSSLYGVIFPLIIYVRKALTKRLFQRNVQINVAETQDKHFNSLRNNWEITAGAKPKTGTACCAAENLTTKQS